MKNSDAVLHNTHGFLGKPTRLQPGPADRDQMIDITRRLTKPGVVRVLCDAHPHMFAWLIVHDSPYYAVTDERGAFRIDGRAARHLQGHDVARGLPAPGRGQGRPPALRRAAHAHARTSPIAPRATTTLDFELR